MDKITYKLSPSSCVEQYFSHLCERFLLYQGIKSGSAKALGFESPQGTGSEIAALAGEAWEEKLARKLIKDDSLIYTLDKKTGGFAKFNTEETISKLVEMVESVKGDKKTRYLYQASLKVTDNFIKDYFRFDKSLYDGTFEGLQVVFSRTHPDLIRASFDEEKNQVVLSIVDMKLAKKMKVEHKVQVTLYVKLLGYLVKEYNDEASNNKLQAVVDTSYGYLWNYGQEQETGFSLQETEPLLEDFFQDVFPRVINKLKVAIEAEDKEQLQKAIDTQIMGNCEWCENYGQCTKRLKTEGNVALLPYLSSYAQEYAKRLNMPKGISEFVEEIERPEISEALSANRSWSRILKDKSLLEIHQDAVPYTYDDMKNAGYKWKGMRSFVMPNWQNIAIIITAQKDVATGRVYGLGYYIGLRREDLDLQERVRLNIATDMSEEAYVDNAITFVRNLYGMLSNVANQNARGRRDSLQGYVMDTYEYNNLEEMLYDLLDNPLTPQEDMEKVMGLLFWMQGERLVTDSNAQPHQVSVAPLIVISREIRKLLSLPIPIAYNLRNIQNTYNAWVNEGDFFGKEDTEYFGRITDMLPPDKIHEIWKIEGEDQVSIDARNALLDKLNKHLTKRLRIEAAILYKLQQEDRSRARNEEEKYLTGRLDQFTLPDANNSNNPLIRKWLFETKYEELLSYSRIRGLRQQELNVAIESGDILKLRVDDVIVENVYNDYWQCDEEQTTLVFNVENADKYKNGEPWFSGLLCKDTPEALRQMYSFADWSNTRFPGPSYENYTVLNFMEFKRVDGQVLLEGKLPNSSPFTVRAGETLYLSERYADFNSGKVINNLNNMDNGNHRELLEPETILREINNPHAVNDIEKAIEYSEQIDEFKFTDSQENAFRHLAKYNLTVLQGPPGTGKTDFIARAVISLCRYFKREKEYNLRVLISANSHAAIENAIYAIGTKLGEGQDIALLKASRFSHDPNIRTYRGVNKVEEKDVEATCTREARPVVVGATSWSCDKMRNLSRPFDLIIIDEASQVRVMDAMITLCKGSVNTSRYLLVGDDDQLPPIIQGKYTKEPDIPYVYGSVFRYFRDPGMLYDLGYCMMLEENFRMNDILSRYSAEKIYGEKYKAFNQAIASRHLEYHQSARQHLRDMSDDTRNYIEYVLDNLNYKKDDYWPLVFCHIKGGNAKAQIEVERYLVAELTNIFKEGIGHGQTSDWFWNGDNSTDGAYGIISPHHRHIEKLKDSIATRTGMDREELFVGTVDKLQGQQREAIVVSYGISDLEDAVVEGEFVYNRNRLNVSLTRAKCKTIVFLSDVLTKMPIELLSSDDEDLQKGAEYVCGFLSFMQKNESDSETSNREFTFNIEGQEVTVEVYRKRLV